jgi:hypothetical protein
MSSFGGRALLGRHLVTKPINALATETHEALLFYTSSPLAWLGRPKGRECGAVIRQIASNPHKPHDSLLETRGIQALGRSTVSKTSK